MARMASSSKLKGIACIIASATGFAFMGAFVRLCDDFGSPVSSFQKSFFRNIVAFLVALAVFARSRSRKDDAGKSSPPGPWSDRRAASKAAALLLLRSVAGTVGIFGNFYALSNIPVGEAMALNKTAPFFTVFLSWLFLREKAGMRTVFALLAAFAGVVLVMKPGFRADGAVFATLCGLAGGFGAGLAYTCVRELALLNVESSMIVLVFSAFSSVASIPFAIASGVCRMNFSQVLVMLGAGVAASVGQFGVTAAYRFAPSREIAVFDYTGVVFTAILGFMFFGQVPDAASVAGFAAIVFAAAYCARR